ncbi:sugar ABC transporter substrate-binding protein [Paenibacillus baekrokdamisoli]|uniref:Sugar ABC transporter substrate-binding protein n=1 Tax=Paenibacillus baekrokdamisoli TaxID=1712516 RepID=A0A3G9IND1_9BACL|nr:sugar ABC transporter substrate-binding protein [Paenibacillus baekrokdamisoli]MBB3067076.1 multiple sugar transport system substrate-binding protein [Paenibacillus baekrokdamisoli]BBH19732.1 sugar ABC transporter substrate-binding protein [Paenibacillus baekrokdamisoli]
MGIRRKDYFLLVLLISTLMTFCGCSSNKQPSVLPSQETETAGNGSENEPVMIRLATAMDPARLDPYKKMINLWNTEHPHIQVELENTPYTDYWQKLRIMTASNSMPDVWVFTPGVGAHWLRNDQILSLDPFIKDDPTLNLQDFNKMMIEYMTYKGSIYGFPYDVSAQVLFYNKDLFDQAQLEYPTNQWTFEDVRNAAKKFVKLKSDKGQVYGLLSTINGDWTADSYYRAFGGSLITDDGKVGINTKGGIAALQYFKDNIKLGITPKPGPGQSSRPIWNNGLAAMMADGGWAIPSFKDVDFHWDMVRLPAGPAGQFTTGLGGTFVISKQTKYPKEAYEILKYLTSTDSLNEIVTKTEAGVPGRISSSAELTPVMKKYADLINNAIPYNALDGSLELQDILSKEIEQLLYGIKTPEEIAQFIEKNGNKALQAKN